MQSGSAISRGASIYLAEIRRFPMLEAEEEHVLAMRWRECGDENAALQLLTSHLRLVAKVSMDYRGYGLPTSDLISEGNVGLIQAMKRFDPDKGIRFSTYAVWWIKASILDYIMRSWSLVKIGTTVNQKKLFFNLSKAKRQISALQQADLDPEKVTLIANELGVAERDVVEMNQRISRDVSLNVPMNQEDDSAEWQDTLVEEGSSQETSLAETEESETRRRALSVALTVLNDRERRIFEGRRLMDPPLTLDDLAVECCISRERVRQIEAMAFQKVRRAAHVARARRRESPKTLPGERAKPTLNEPAQEAPHHDRPPFLGRPSLTGHNGHGCTCCWFRPVANDPEPT
jgi:RNA polymerase sigma-32 factor